MSSRQFWPWLVAAMILPLGLGFVLFLVHLEFEQSEQLSLQVGSSYSAREDLGSLLKLHQDVELGQRGYILTGDSQFLEPYSVARPRLEQIFRKVSSAIGHGPQILTLRRLSEQKLAFVDRTLELARRGDPEAAREAIAGGEGKRLMDGIRSTIADLQSVEAGRLEERIALARDARLQLQWIVLVIAAVLTLALMVAILAVARALKMQGQTVGRYRDLSARQEAIFEGAKDGIITINQSGSIESANSAIATMTGYSLEEVLRRDIGVLFEVAPDTGKKETFLRRLARGAFASDEESVELWARRKDGTLFPSDVLVSAVKLAESTIFVAIVRDVSERRRIAQMKSEFVSTVSHELRTPLTSIAGSLGLIAGGAAGEMPEKAGRLVAIARSNCDRLIRLINDILDMEKLESGKFEFQLRPVALEPFLQQAVDANTGYANGHSVSLHLEAVPPTAAVVADPDPLMQVLNNLLSNAAKFSKPGGTVAIRVWPLDRRWRIAVEDHGEGIPEDFRSRIFGKFAQAEGSDNRKKGGTGLGLSIVQEIVTRMGGEISFDSAEGQGSTFYVDLPAEPVRPTERSLSKTSRMSVLHIEDDPDVLAIVSDALKGRYILHAAQSLAEAKQNLSQRSYDIIILDFALPDGSGKDLIPYLREKKAQILVFTAQDADPKVAQEVDALLVKSRSSLEGLVDTLDRLLQSEKARQRTPDDD